MAIEPPSAHVADTHIQPFLRPDFDPVTYLNTALPPLSISSLSSARSGRAVPLPDLSSQLQTLLSQLNAQTSRLSNTLTQLTDEIIRTGSRLEYEVEVLRGEAVGVTDTFENELKKDVELLAPSVTHVEPLLDEEAGQDGTSTLAERTKQTTATEPEFLERLRTLTTVHERLDSVIKTFGSAMQWPLAPSELSLASSFISVSAPESSEDTRSREEKGKEYAEKLRSEIDDLLASGAEGVRAANDRVEELHRLAEVWRGTAEEKARLKVVETLRKVVDDKQRSMNKASDLGSRKPGETSVKGYDHRYGNTDIVKLTADGGSGYGFLQNLRNLKNDMYLE